MTRVVSVGRSKRLALTGTGLALFVLGSVGLSGCPGTLDESEFPPASAGTAGTSGGAGTTGAAGTGAAGTTGTAGTTGAAGTGSGAVGCAEAPAIFEAKGCATAGACHDKDGAGAGFKMAPTGWEKNLVGMKPKAGGVLASMCLASTVPYLTAKSNPATGLFIDKLKNARPACGDQMPSIGEKLTATEMTCIQNWANKVVADTP